MIPLLQRALGEIDITIKFRKILHILVFQSFTTPMRTCHHIQ
jgi:hypothetical protein